MKPSPLTWKTSKRALEECETWSGLREWLAGVAHSLDDETRTTEEVESPSLSDRGDD